MLFFGTFAFGLQSSASSSPRCFQTRSLRRPPVAPPSHRRPPEQLSSEGLHRPSRPSFPTPSSPSRFPASQVCLRSLYARALLAGSGKGHRGPGGTGVGRSCHSRVLCRSLCRHHCSSRAAPCADASEPDRQGLREARPKENCKTGLDRRFARPNSDLDGSSAPLHPPFRPSQAGPGVDRRRATPPLLDPTREGEGTG
jgi:hypothetical protein